MQSLEAAKGTQPPGSRSCRTIAAIQAKRSQAWTLISVDVPEHGRFQKLQDLADPSELFTPDNQLIC